MNWPTDERDELSRLAKQLFQAHFDIQSALVRFHLDAEVGQHVPDTVYSDLFRSIGKLQQISIDLRIMLIGFRTTTRIPAQQKGGDAQKSE